MTAPHRFMARRARHTGRALALVAGLLAAACGPDCEIAAQGLAGTLGGQAWDEVEAIVHPQSGVGDGSPGIGLYAENLIANDTECQSPAARGLLVQRHFAKIDLAGVALRPGKQELEVPAQVCLVDASASPAVVSCGEELTARLRLDQVSPTIVNGAACLASGEDRISGSFSAINCVQ